MAKGKVKISGARFDELMAQARADRFLRLNAAWRDRVPAHTDRAAERAFRQMEAWIAAGAVPAQAQPPAAETRLPRRAGGAGASAALKLAAVTTSAAVLLGAGSYIASPAVRDAVNGALGAARTADAGSRRPADYVIPSPGEGYTLRADVATDTMAAKWFVADRRLLMVQISGQLPEEPEGDGEIVVVGGMVGMAYDVEGDRQLIIRDGENSILIKMFNADRQELLDYAAVFAAANE